LPHRQPPRSSIVDHLDRSLWEDRAAVKVIGATSAPVQGDRVRFGAGGCRTGGRDELSGIRTISSKAFKTGTVVHARPGISGFMTRPSTRSPGLWERGHTEEEEEVRIGQPKGPG
jgi:hypothetical protein